MASSIFIDKYFNRQEVRINKLKQAFEVLLNDPNLTDEMREEIECDLNSGLSIDILYQKWINKQQYFY